METGQQGVLRGRRRAVGKGDDVVARQEPGDPVRGNVAAVHLDPAVEPRVGRQLADAPAGIPPELARDGEADAGHVTDGVDEEVHALVVADDAQGQEADGAVAAGTGLARLGWSSRQVRREGELLDVAGTQLRGESRLVVGVDDHGVDPADQGLHQLPVAGVGSRAGERCGR